MIKFCSSIFRHQSLLRPPLNFFSHASNPNESDSHTLELYDEHYLSLRTAEFKDSYKINSDSKIQGWASPEGTLKFSQRRKEFVHEKNFRKPYFGDLTLSSIGIGTYVGAPDENDDLKVSHSSLIFVLLIALDVQRYSR